MENQSTKLTEAKALYVQGQYKESMPLFKEIAKSGDPEAQYYLSTLYSGRCIEGFNSPFDMFRYQKMSADQGFHYAQYDLAISYYDALGTPRDVYEYARYLKMAADGGVPDAIYDYGVALENGIGVDRSATKAMAYYKMAHEAGSTYAQRGIDALNKKYPYTPSGEIDISSTKYTLWMVIPLLLLAGFMSLCLVGLLEELDDNVVFYTFAITLGGTILSILLALARLKLGGLLLTRLLPLAIIVSSIISYFFGGDFNSIAELLALIIISLIPIFITYLLLQITSHGVPYWNVLMGIEYDGTGVILGRLTKYFTYGYGEEYEEDSP